MKVSEFKLNHWYIQGKVNRLSLETNDFYKILELRKITDTSYDATLAYVQLNEDGAYTLEDIQPFAYVLSEWTSIDDEPLEDKQLIKKLNLMLLK